jgi:uncharacterized DUF497 family protein
MEFDWEIRKAESNYKKHGVRFSECLPVFQDDYAITIIDEESEPSETRFVTIGVGVKVGCWLLSTPTVAPISESFRPVWQSHTREHNTRNADETAV